MYRCELLVNLVQGPRSGMGYFIEIPFRVYSTLPYAICSEVMHIRYIHLQTIPLLATPITIRPMAITIGKSFSRMPRLDIRLGGHI